MIDLPYSLEIEATEDPTFFGFHSPILSDSRESVIPSKIAWTRPAGECASMSRRSRSKGYRSRHLAPIRP